MLEIRVLTDYRDQMISERVRLNSRLRWHLVQIALPLTGHDRDRRGVGTSAKTPRRVDPLVPIRGLHGHPLHPPLTDATNRPAGSGICWAARM